MATSLKQKKKNHVNYNLVVSTNSSVDSLSSKPIELPKGWKAHLYNPLKKKNKDKWKSSQIIFKVNSNEKDKDSENKSIHKKERIISFDENLMNWKPLALFHKIVKKSIIDNSSTLYMYKDGTFEYFGESPIGMMIISYYLTVMNKSKTSSNIKVDITNEALCFPIGTVKEATLAQQYYINECVDAYFEYYSHFCPVVDEILFRKNPDPFILKTITSIGYRYLAKGVPVPEISQILDQEAIKEYHKNKYKPSLKLVACYTLISQYQSFLTESANAWFYQSLNSHLCRMLGMNKEPPKILKFSNRYLRLRYNQWCACSIQDKMYSFVLSRPFNIEVNSWIQPSPNFLPLKRLGEIPTHSEKREVMERASFIYWRGKYLITEMLGSICVFKKDWSLYNKKVPEKMMLSFLKGFTVFDLKHRETMKLLWENRPKWVFDICQKFLMYHEVFLNALIIEACTLYIKIPNHIKIPNLKRTLFIASLQVVHAALSLGENFLRFGILFRIHSLSVALLSIGNFLYFKDSELSSNDMNIIINQIFQDRSDELNLKDVYENGLKILSDTKHYFPMALEYLNAILDFFNY